MTSPYGKFIIEPQHLGLFYTCLTIVMIFGVIISLSFSIVATLIFVILSAINAYLAYHFFRIEKNAR
jgi:uncharacterized membrane protein YagU involved in acid resistance